MRVGGGLYAESIHVAGCLNLWGAEAFTIEVTNAHLSFDAGPAFRGDGVSLRQDLNCSNVTVSDGGISLFGATIGGQFWLNDAEVSHRTGWAVNAPMVTVGGGIYGSGLAANGGVNLFAATISESIELPHSTLIPYRHRSLRAPGSHIGGNLILDDALHIAGTIDLSRAEIKGALTISSATFPDTDDTTVDLQRATIGIFDMTGLSVPPAALDLRGAIIDTIDDEPDSWPQRIAFRMLTYRALNPLLPAGRRLVWLGRDDDNYHPQPYEHLAAHYRQQGHDNDERAVLLARHRLRRRNLRPLAQVWGYFEDATTGYGYRPVRALGWLLVLTTVVATVFSITPPRSLQPDSGSPFHPVAYALDLILPILDLGQQSSFIPVGATQWLAWASSLAGWLLATTVIAGITRALTRS
jgi:hypothetical protein